jgi:hypothetical protein
MELVVGGLVAETSKDEITRVVAEMDKLASGKGGDATKTVAMQGYHR